MKTPDAHTLGSRWVVAILIAYLAGVLLFPPRVIVIGDEMQYVGQAVAFANGRLVLSDTSILYPAPATADLVTSDYPPGTSLIQAPFVWLTGSWRGAIAASVLALVAATLITARWLSEAGLNQAFALLVPGFFGSAFFGRVGMSDVPSAAIVALSAWLLWRSDSRAWTWSLAAGLACGLSLLFRETNVVLLAPLVVDALLRRRAVAWALCAGGLLGIAARLGISQWLFGNALYVRDSGYGFSLGSLTHSALPFGIALLVMFPLGALLPFAYRGPRRAALVTAVTGYFLLFLLYDYDSITENGPMKGLILASRFAVPAVPLLAYMAADVFPRWRARLKGTSARIAGVGTTVAAAGIALAVFAVHPLAQRQESVPLAVVRAMYEHTSERTPVITNHKATLKYLSPVYGPRRLVLRSAIDSVLLENLQRAHGTLSLALMDRYDSEMFRADAEENETFVARAGRQCRLTMRYESQIAAWARVRVFDVRACDSTRALVPEGQPGELKAAHGTRGFLHHDKS